MNVFCVSPGAHPRKLSLALYVNKVLPLHPRGTVHILRNTVLEIYFISQRMRVYTSVVVFFRQFLIDVIRMTVKNWIPWIFKLLSYFLLYFWRIFFHIFVYDCD